MRNHFAGRLATAITAAGLSHRDVAERLQVHPNRISEWVRGKGVPKVPQIVQLAEILDVTLDWLLTDRKDKHSMERRVVEDLAVMAPSLANLVRRAQQLIAAQASDR